MRIRIRLQSCSGHSCECKLKQFHNLPHQALFLSSSPKLTNHDLFFPFILWSMYLSDEGVGSGQLTYFGPALLQQIEMKPLTQQQIKQQQLQLLEMSGFSLAQYTSNSNTPTLFKEVPHPASLHSLERLSTTHVKNFGLSANANLKAFAYALLVSIFSSPVKEDVLSILKSWLYSWEMELTAIKHSPLSTLSSNEMKKLVVEFFFTLAYASYEDKIDDKLKKYPIVMDILVLFLRALLAKSDVKHAEDCLFTLPTKETYEILVAMFDINCQKANSIYLFYDDRLFLCENQNHEVLSGFYSQNEAQRGTNTHHLRHTLKLSDLQEEIEEDTENEKSEVPSSSVHNRSLELRGIVSESIVFEPEAITPFFNLENDHNSSFQSNPERETPSDDAQVRKQRDSLMKGSKEMSLLKLMDRSVNVHHHVGLGNVARSKIIENYMKESLQGRQAMGMKMDSPITLDSPHTLFSEGNFADLQIKEEIRVMKKSKSERNSRTDNTAQNNIQEGDSQKDMKKKERVQFGQPKQQTTCECVENKKKSIKLCSNLYEINMMYLPKQTKEPKRKFVYNPLIDPTRNQLYTSSKGVNMEIEAANNQFSSLQQMRETRQRKNANLNTSIHSCTLLQRCHKDSETQSKREFSPISVQGDRSTSPFAESRSIASPKITFTYQNKLNSPILFHGAKKRQ